MNREVSVAGGINPYGQSWDGYDELDEELEDLEAEQELDPAAFDPMDDDPFFGYDDGDEDDDDLLAALDEALDEVEAEARIELVRSIASPELDVLELVPLIDTAYRDAISAFMGERSGASAPRYSQMARVYAFNDPDLGALLQDYLHRSRASVEKRRAEICWV